MTNNYNSELHFYFSSRGAWQLGTKLGGSLVIHQRARLTPTPAVI